jgi:hypothetical protein
VHAVQAARGSFSPLKNKAAARSKTGGCTDVSPVTRPYFFLADFLAGAFFAAFFTVFLALAISFSFLGIVVLVLIFRPLDFHLTSTWRTMRRVG